MHDRLFEAALGIAPPWFVAGVRFDEVRKVLTVGIDFTAGTWFAAEGAGGEHPVQGIGGVKSCLCPTSRVRCIGSIRFLYPVLPGEARGRFSLGRNFKIP